MCVVLCSRRRGWCGIERPDSESERREMVEKRSVWERFVNFGKLLQNAGHARDGLRMALIRTRRGRTGGGGRGGRENSTHSRYMSFTPSP